MACLIPNVDCGLVRLSLRIKRNETVFEGRARQRKRRSLSERRNGDGGTTVSVVFAIWSPPSLPLSEGRKEGRKAKSSNNQPSRGGGGGGGGHVLLPKASVLMQRLSYPTETVLSNKITRNNIVLSFKHCPRKPLRRQPLVSLQSAPTVLGTKVHLVHLHWYKPRL